MSDKKRKRLPTIGMVASGCLLTLLIWFVALSVIFGELAGDCFPELGSQCPSDHERNVGALYPDSLIRTHVPIDASRWT